MIIERNLGSFIVHAEDPVSRALEKITANRARVIFLVSQHGELRGALSDGDFRRWVSGQADIDLSRPAIEAANTKVRSAPETSSTAEIQALFAPGVDMIPLLDERRHLRAIAINRTDELRIGRHVVAPDAPAVLISEIGINHQGSIDFAKELVDLSVASGADVVKFQLRDMDALYRQGSGSSLGEDLGPQYTLDLLAKYNLGADELFQVFDHCRDVGVEVMCTPWDAPSVDRLAEYGIPALKFASADLTNHALIRHAVGKSLPLVLSTGMSTEAEIEETAGLLRSLGAAYAMLHCQSTYPAPFKDVNLRYLSRLAEIGQCPVGYSGHERGFHVPLGAVALGAKIIEKHFTTDRGLEGNDHKVSLLPSEFKEMVQRIRELEQALGSSGPRGVSTGEMMNRVNLAKSLVAARRIETGEVIAASAVDIKSPGRGLQPNAYERLIGRIASRPLEPGDFFYATDLGDGGRQGRQYNFRRPWGLAARFHDIETMTRDCTPDFLEFHFSYRDLEIEPSAVFSHRLETGLATHAPELFSGDFLLDLASDDDQHWERSIWELQRVVDLTRSMKPYFRPDPLDPVVVVNPGGFTRSAHVERDELEAMYDRVAAGLARIDESGVRLLPQTLPPYPWLMGGQLHHNLFVNPDDTVDFAKRHDRRLCLDISHSKLAANFVGLPFSEVVDKLAPFADHLHLVDGTGVDGEGIQIGEGEVDWALLAQQLDQLAPGVSFIPEIWQGHVNDGEGFWIALERLEQWF